MINIKVLEGDAMQVIGDIKPKSIDAVLTSPPFQLEDVIYMNWLKNILGKLESVTRDYIFMFNSSTRLKEICRETDPHRVLIWNKKASMYPYRYEPIFVYKMDTAEYNINRYIWSDIVSYLPIHDGKHPNENPIELYVRLLHYLKKSQVILDPFAGSGTTLKACSVLNKDVVLIEKDKKYVSMIKESMKNLTHDLREVYF